MNVFDCFLVQPIGSMVLVNLVAVDAGRLVPATWRQAACCGGFQVFRPAPTLAQRREWFEETAPRAKVEQERRARCEAVQPVPVDDVKVLPGLLQRSLSVFRDMCVLGGGATVPVTLSF